ANMAGATTQFRIANTGWSSGEQWDGILFGVAISNVKLDPDSFALLTAAEPDKLSGLSDITVVDDAIVSLRYDDTEYVVANEDLMLGTTTRWYIVDGVKTLWVEGDPAPADTVSGTSNAKEGDVGSNADNFLFSLDGATNMSSIDGIDFQETIFPILTDTIFVFERGGNDAGTWQAILADGSLGEPVTLDKASNGGPYADTGIAVGTPIQNAFGVVFKTVEPAQGVRITASGHDTLSISIPRPVPLQIPMTSVAPIIDGEMDAIWDDVEETQCRITNIVNADSATPEGPNDLSATFKAMYDADNIYVFVAVKDSFINGTISDYTDDGVEIFFDGDNSKGATYDGVNDTQIRITVDDVNLPDTDSSISKEGTAFKVILTDSGYNIEASFPLDVLQITPGNVFGFEMQVNDNDANGRETIMRWFSNNNDSWRDASLFGQAVLVDPLKKNLVALWDLDEGSGTTAADGSGNGLDGMVEGAPAWTSPGWDGTGSCMQFGGDSDRITVESFDVMGSGITLAAWVYPITFMDDARMISKSEGGSTNLHYWAMVLSGTGEDNLQFRLRTDVGNTTSYLSAEGTELSANEWTHVAVTWDAADPVMRLYKNAVEIDNASKDGTMVATGDGVKIGIGNQSISALAQGPGMVFQFPDAPDLPAQTGRHRYRNHLP
ncbi:MAG: hypothetical protein ISS70_15520, partial [Phycisphaerae bacterium]|nr:hypothetical protein [Phycisphaerae bacterium]